MIKVEQLLNNLKHIKVLTGKETLNREVNEPDIVRPGLSLVEEISNFPYNRVQVYGNIEMEFLNRHNFTFVERTRLLNPKIPLILFARDLQPTDEFVKRANELGICVAITSTTTTKLVSRIHRYLEYVLAPMTSVHGVLLNVHGIGVLIKGKSGIGKSEIALDLITKGHILIADDSVRIRKIDEVTLIGEAPELLRNRLEIRGIGIVDVQKLHGVTSVAHEISIDLIIELVDLEMSFDRIGTEYLKEEILGTSVKKIQLPVTSGRSIANLIEVAVANYQLKVDHNYDSSKEFVEDLNRMLLEKNDNER